MYLYKNQLSVLNIIEFVLSIQISTLNVLVYTVKLQLKYLQTALIDKIAAVAETANTIVVAVNLENGLTSVTGKKLELKNLKTGKADIIMEDLRLIDFFIS